ncbi:MAG TPA: hypothetical protein VJ967_06415 [Clostridia bacterium]|nr:hypothetical protein [Clostridia bacterium]
MKFERLLEIAADLHCFSPSILSAGERIQQVRVNLNRWVRSGRVLRLHKGWYTLAEPYRRVTISMPVVACSIKPGSYVSLQSALSQHGLIPEYVPETVSVTTGRPQLIHTPFGRIRYRHLKHEAFWGYEETAYGSQTAFIARPEKALLDLFYLTPGSVDRPYVRELRLQNLEHLRLDVLARMAEHYRSRRLTHLPALLREIMEME